MTQLLRPVTCLACTTARPMKGKPWCSKQCRAALRDWGRHEYPDATAAEQLAAVLRRASGLGDLGHHGPPSERVARFLSQPPRTVLDEQHGQDRSPRATSASAASSTPGAKPTEASPAPGAHAAAAARPHHVTEPAAPRAASNVGEPL